jgi:hypothetical protein
MWPTYTRYIHVFILLPYSYCTNLQVPKEAHQTKYRKNQSIYVHRRASDNSSHLILYCISSLLKFLSLLLLLSIYIMSLVTLLQISRKVSGQQQQFIQFVFNCTCLQFYLVVGFTPWCTLSLKHCFTFAGQTIFAFDHKTGRFSLAPEFTFHLVVTQTPCGDASLYSNCASPTESGRTGAKLVPPCALLSRLPPCICATHPEPRTTGTEESMGASRHDFPDAAAPNQVAALNTTNLDSAAATAPVKQVSAAIVDACVDIPVDVQAATGRLNDASLKLKGFTKPFAGPSKGHTADGMTECTGQDRDCVDPSSSDFTHYRYKCAVLPKASDVEHGVQEKGCLRRKPGKGAPTLSMSCRRDSAHMHAIQWPRE